MIRLINIQSELRATKDAYNSFGKYSYRSAESILSALKPLLMKHGVAITLSDNVLVIGTRYYIKATATMVDTDGKVIATTDAFAREDEQKKGMDGSQVTGSASSYARKYALCGLLAIDDNKDADAYPPPEEQPAPKPAPKQQKQVQSAPLQMYYCTHCGKPLDKETDRDGKPYPMSQFVTMSRKRFGMDLCSDCMRAEWEARQAVEDQFFGGGGNGQ